MCTAARRPCPCYASFGEGVVTVSDTEVTVEFEGGVGVKRLLLSFAPLEKLG